MQLISGLARCHPEGFGCREIVAGEISFVKPFFEGDKDQFFSLSEILCFVQIVA